MPAVELYLHTAYCFGQGASLAEEHVARAADMGYTHLAVTDRDSLAGTLEFAQAARAWGLKPIVGAELSLAGGGRLLLIAETRRGYGNLCRLVTLAHAQDRRSPALSPLVLKGHAEGLVCIPGGSDASRSERPWPSAAPCRRT